MNIIFFTQDDPFYVKVFFDEFFKIYEKREEIKAIVISRSMGKKSKYLLAKQMLEFYGYYDFLKIGFKYALYKLLAKRRLKNKQPGIRTYSVQQTAELYDIPVILRSDLNSSKFIDSIKALNGDLFISVASPIIWKEALIRTPAMDCINIHNAPLPNYRGMLPNFWQLYCGEKNVGITVHRIDIGIDTGAIVEQVKIDIENKNMSLDTLIKETKKIGAHIMADVIDKYRKGNVEYREMQGNGSYFSFPKKKDVQEFRKRGGRLI
jgi:methionyl-tRNA formyltransferase